MLSSFPQLALQDSGDHLFRPAIESRHAHVEVVPVVEHANLCGLARWRALARLSLAKALRR
jgi:hypothetical protein